MDCSPIWTAFRRNTLITAFDEFQHFNNLSSLPRILDGGQFYSCLNLLTIIIPDPKTHLLGRTFLSNDGKLKKVVVKEGVKTIEGSFLYGCTSMEYVELPSTLTKFDIYSGATYNTFYNVPSSCSVILKASTPPSATNSVFDRFYGKFYVPDDSVEAYKADTGWSSIAARIFPLSEYER